jgi:hypothetical protein
MTTIMPHSYPTSQKPLPDSALVYHHYGGALTAAGLPKALVAEGDGLALAPWDGLRGIWQREARPEGWRTYPFGSAAAGEWQVDGERITGACAYGADALVADAGAPDIDLEAEVTLRSGDRAGIAVGMRPDRGSPGFACLLDAARAEITVGRFERAGHGSGPCLDTLIDTARRPLARDRAYRLRLLRRSRFLELFVDDRLVFSVALGEQPAGGAVACVVESGAAEFRFTRVHALEPLARG